MKRTPDMEPGTDFQAFAEITKAYVDTRTGQRHIVGVASGVEVDRDGERCSKSCISGMVNDVKAGGVKATGAHQQDWMTEFGDVVTAEHDATTGEFSIDTVLPPEGNDPIADKAWRTANTEKVGWSIGGKLLKSYFERNELGKKRKVLDAIKLRHVMLTKHPAYQLSFAEAVAKTWTGDEPADDEFTLDTVDDDVEKDTTTGSWANGDSDSGGGNTGRDSVGSGQRNAGQRKPGTKGMSTEDDGSNEADDGSDLPKVKDERHLACPNCGHEFAADLPVDPDDRQADDTNSPDDEDADQDTGKSTQSPDPETTEMSKQLSETLDSLKALVASDEVAKTEPAAGEPDVTKTDTTDQPDVLKMIAVSHKAHEDRFGDLETSIGEGFALIAKAFGGLRDQVADMPVGRKSTARVLPPPTGHDETVEKSVKERIEEAPDALAALKIQNEAVYGIR